MEEAKPMEMARSNLQNGDAPSPKPSRLALQLRALPRKSYPTQQYAFVSVKSNSTGKTGTSFSHRKSGGCDVDSDMLGTGSVFVSKLSIRKSIGSKPRWILDGCRCFLLNFSVVPSEKNHNS